MSLNNWNFDVENSSSSVDVKLLLLHVIITSMWLGFTIFSLVSSDDFFVVIYSFLSLVLTIDFCYSQLILFCILFKKDKKNK